jgi:uncharacterized protein YndB with AHSA1/START domain
MPVTSVTVDPEALTLTLIADVAATPERLWRAFTEPAQLERFWGPPGWPASFTRFDFTVGGIASYHMTGPRGELAHARWEFLVIDAPHRFEVLDTFADENGDSVPDMPGMRATFAVEPTATGARLVSVSHFVSVEALEQMLAMGMREGFTMAISQLDAVLRDLRDYALGAGTQVEVLDDTHVRITRLIEGPRELVWRAHREPELLKTWLLGPDGWEMTIAEPGLAAGDTYRYAWAPVEGGEGQAFGFEGDTLVVDAPRRVVTTERMTGMPGPSTLNDLTLYEEDGVTLLTLLIEYPDAATRDMILGTGMTEGMERSYQRLDALAAV